MRAEAVPLITQDDETGEYLLAEESFDILKDIEAPLAVVAIAGLWRTGKSYLLNQLSGGKGTGFQVGATVNACTKGLWLWGEPVKLEDGLTVLFIDTEGLGSTSRTQTEDSQIFSLALLLSSLFVWNSRGVIDGNALEDFALVVNLTKHIHVRTNAGTKATGEQKKKAPSTKNSAVSHELEALAEHFPSFMWVVRDFTLRLEDHGRKINDRQYLENALKPQNSFSSEAASRNQIRTLLGTFFKERDCVTLVRPAEDEDTLRNLKHVPFEQLRPEFQKGMTSLKNKVYATLRPKAVNGRALSGSMLSTLAKTYVDALNSGGVPTISTAWDRVLTNQANEAVDKALQQYDAYLARNMLTSPDTEKLTKLLGDKRSLHLVAASFDDDDEQPARRKKRQDDDEDVVAAAVIEAVAPGLPVDESAVTTAHDEGAGIAADVFTKAVWASDADADPTAASPDGGAVLTTALNERKLRLHTMNDLASQRACTSLLEDLRRDPDIFHRPSYKKASKRGGSFAEDIQAQIAAIDDDDVKVRKLYLQDLNEAEAWLGDFEARCDALVAAYRERAIGPAKWDVFVDHGTPALFEVALEWANELGVRHRGVSKLVRAHAAQLEEQYQTSNGELVASDAAVKRELDGLDRAANDSKVAADAALEALNSRVDAAKAELQRHQRAADRLTGAFDFAHGLIENQHGLQKELFDDMKRVLQSLRDACNNTNGADEEHEDDDDDDSDESDSDSDSEDDKKKKKKKKKKKGTLMRMISGGGGGKKKKTTKNGKKKKKEETWDFSDLGFEQEEMAEFGPMSMGELKERIAEDEKELELMHEHAALTIEHAKVKKMLLADKDHELQEYEYQWGVAKANVAASEGELMVVDEELAVLKGTVLQMHRYLEQTSRSGKLPTDLVKALTKDQRLLLDDLLASQPP